MSLTRLAKTGLFKRISVEEWINSDLQKEITLHRAVLDQALLDYFSMDPDTKQDVVGWLSVDNQEFIDACDRAALDPDLVYKTFRAMKEILKGDNAKFRLFVGKTSKDE